MEPLSGFTRDLKCIDPRYYAKWNDRTCRWEIHCRHTRGPHSLIMIVCKKDEDLNDIGYHPLDARVIHALKLGKYHSDNPEALIREVDEANEDLEKEADEEAEMAQGDLNRDLKRHYGKSAPDATYKNVVMVDLGRR